jgi:hypothetical protein
MQRPDSKEYVETYIPDLLNVPLPSSIIQLIALFYDYHVYSSSSPARFEALIFDDNLMERFTRNSIALANNSFYVDPSFWTFEIEVGDVFVIYWDRVSAVPSSFKENVPIVALEGESWYFYCAPNNVLIAGPYIWSNESSTGVPPTITCYFRDARHKFPQFENLALRNDDEYVRKLGTFPTEWEFCIFGGSLFVRFYGLTLPSVYDEHDGWFQFINADETSVKTFYSRLCQEPRIVMEIEIQVHNAIESEIFTISQLFDLFRAPFCYSQPWIRGWDDGLSHGDRDAQKTYHYSLPESDVAHFRCFFESSFHNTSVITFSFSWKRLDANPFSARYCHHSDSAPWY